MGFKERNRNSYRPRPPKQPIRLAFGLIESKTDQIPKQVIAPSVEFEKQEIIGTLNLKKMDLNKAKPLPEKHIERILKNLSKIYEEGKYTSSQTVLDLEENSQVLKVSFSYNQNSIDRIKGLDRNERQWDPENRLWRVFIGCFDDLFDIFGKGFKLTDPAYYALQEFIRSKYYANIAQGKLGKLILRESFYEEFDLNTQVPEQQVQQKSNIFKKLISKFHFKRKPYSHQITGIEFLLQNESCALLDEMGCGKSFQIASTISMLLENKSIDKCLVVAPKSLVRTWKEELSLATDLPFTVIEGTPNQRQQLLKSPAPIFVIHYEGIRLEKELLADWLNQGTSMVVFDESQRIKNLNAQTTLSAKYIRQNAKRCVIATGTPIANRPMDLFAQYFVMDNGATFGSNFTAFKNTFCYIDILEINQGRRKIKVEKFIGVRNGEELRRRVQATSLRRLKSDVLDLPPIINKDYAVELKPEQKTLYAKMRDNVRSEIENMSEQEYAQQANNVVVRLLRLSQLASNPALINPSYDGPNAKFDELDDLLTDIFSDDTKKVILWSHFVENVNFLTEKYQETWGAVAHTGEMNLDERAVSISDFQDNPNVRLFIATPQSAKEGLTLLPRDGKMRADTMIYLDLNFDAGSYVQSQARFHRIGQTAEKCLVIHFLGVNTVDEYIKKTLVNKLQVAMHVLDNVALHAETEGLQNQSVSLSKQDVLSILS